MRTIDPEILAAAMAGEFECRMCDRPRKPGSAFCSPGCRRAYRNGNSLRVREERGRICRECGGTIKYNSRGGNKVFQRRKFCSVACNNMHIKKNRVIRMKAKNEEAREIKTLVGYDSNGVPIYKVEPGAALNNFF